MFYNFAIFVPAGKPEDSPVVQELYLTFGVVHMVIIKGRPGFNGEVKVRLYRFEHQIIPTNPGEAVLPGRFPIIYPEHHFIVNSPYTLKVRAYSPGAKHNHTFELSIGILHPEHFPEYQEERGMLTKFLELVGIRR